MSGKQPIIILHGWASRISRWKRFKKDLEKIGYKVYLPILPGFRKKLEKPWNLNDYAFWLKSYLEEKKLEKPILIAHSFGGSIAIVFVARFPKAIKKMVLLAPSGIRKKSFKVTVFNMLAKIGKISLLPAPFLKKFARFILYALLSEKDYYKATPIMRETLKNILKEDVVKYLLKIKIPVLLIWGEKDRMTPVKFGYIMEKRIPRVKLLIFKDAGHGLFFQQREKILEKIYQFL